MEYRFLKEREILQKGDEMLMMYLEGYYWDKIITTKWFGKSQISRLEGDMKLFRRPIAPKKRISRYRQLKEGEVIKEGDLIGWHQKNKSKKLKRSKIVDSVGTSVNKEDFKNGWSFWRLRHVKTRQ
jgi:hypothetical protein